MNSPLKSETARINGAQSHGPATPEGKAAASQNSLRHGLNSKQVVLPGEDPEEFDRHRAAYLQIYRPQDHAEKHLVETIAAAAWRLKRMMQIETAMLSDENADLFRTLGLIARYENQLNRTQDLAIKRLAALQENRPASLKAPAPIQRNEPKDTSDLSELDLHRAIHDALTMPVPRQAPPTPPQKASGGPA
ncbi:MAG TPA: hypothetical protein VN841_00205 [Bryobacteraceae bacterium]|nr:hypothetical protein [Bryobacteraceae bacterium]